jgi:hypothetical protein
MPSPPVQVAVAVLPEAQPVLDAFARLHIDVGSIALDRFDPLAAADHRCLCIATTESIDHLARALREELADEPAALALTDRVMPVPGPFKHVTLLVFLDLIALEL